jgi:hypothetical protein
VVLCAPTDGFGEVVVAVEIEPVGKSEPDVTWVFGHGINLAMGTDSGGWQALKRPGAGAGWGVRSLEVPHVGRRGRDLPSDTPLVIGSWSVDRIGLDG